MAVGSALQAAADKARAANEKRYGEGLDLWDQIIQRYQPGQGFGAGAMASYERAKTKAVGSGMQQLVSAGLANTTVAAGIGKKYEEEVGTPFRLQLQDMQSERLSGAQAGKAGFIERRTDSYPDAGLAASLGQQTGFAQGFQSGGGDNFTMPGFGGERASNPTRGGGQSAGISGPNFQNTRAGGGSLSSGGANMGPPAPFNPSGTGGEAKIASMTAADFARMGARSSDEEAMYQQWIKLQGGMNAAYGPGTGSQLPKKTTSHFPSSGIGWSAK